MRRVPSTLVRSVAVAAALALAVAGCGSSGKKDAPKSEALSSDQANSALLTAAEIGTGFKLDESTADTNSDKPGCLSTLDESKTEAAVKADRDYAADNQQGTPLVSSQIRSYDNTDAAKTAFDAVLSVLKGCKTVDATDKDGVAYKLTITVDETKTFTEGDDQLNFTATGSITQAGQLFPVVLTYSAARLKNTVTILVVTDVAQQATPGISELFNKVGKRLVAINQGKDPDAA